MAYSNKYKKVKKMRKIDTAYIAGIIDGEGTITLTKRRSGLQRCIGITISSTERVMLEWIQNTIGVGQITNKKSYKKEHSESFVYGIFNRQALDLLRQTTPYLLTYKKKRAELCLKKYEKLTPRNGKYTDELYKNRKRFIDDFMKLKANI